MMMMMMMMMMGGARDTCRGEEKYVQYIGGETNVGDYLEYLCID